MKFRTLIPVLVIAVGMLVPVLSIAQEPIPPDPIDNPADIPIDGGLSILLAAGVGYGAKKINDQRKKKLSANNEK